MVDSKGDISALNEHHLSEDFNLVQALQIDKEKFPEISSEGRFTLETNSENNKAGEDGASTVERETQEDDTNSIDSSDDLDGFVKILKEIVKLDNIVSSTWNPLDESILAYGEKNSVARLARIVETDQEGKILETHDNSGVETSFCSECK